MTKKNIDLRARLDSEININDLDKKVNYEGYSLTFKNDRISNLTDENELFPMEKDCNGVSTENNE